MVQFFFGSLRTESEAIGEEKRANKKETNDPQHRPNRVFSIITLLPIFRQYIGKCELSRQS